MQVEDGRATAVSLRNVPSFLHETAAVVQAPGLGPVTYDMAFGGNFYALVDAASVGLRAEPEEAQALIESGLAIMGAINASAPPVHPEDERIQGCRHVVFHEPGTDGADAKAATSIHPGWLDRSPCGTGTSARIAQLHALGELKTGEDFVNESVIGTRFTGRAGRGDHRRRAARDRARDHRPRLDHRHRPVPARPDRPLPSRLPPGVSRSPDVVVVGAGIVGCATAYELTKRGVSVTLVDRGEVSGGTTGLGEGNALLLRQGRRPRAGPGRRRACRCSTSSRRWWATPRASGARAR